MQTVFLTSFIGGYRKTEKGKEIIKCDNSNHFIDRLKFYKKKLTKFVLIASNPSGYEKTDEYTNIFVSALNLDGFEIENVDVIDNRFNGDLEKTINNADIVFLTGGHTPTQNQFIKQIGLDKILKTYDGIIVGQSAGSMNLAKTVYAPPETIEDLNIEYEREFSGVGLTNIRIMPHMALAYSDNVDGNGKNTYDFCLEDSKNFEIYGIYDGGFIEIFNKKPVAYGKTLLIKNGTFKTLCLNGECVKIKEDHLEK